MESNSFDKLTKGWVTGTSRRSLLKLALGTSLGGVLGAVGLAEAEAARQVGQTCRRSSDCTSGICEISTDGRRRCLPLTCHGSTCLEISTPAGACFWLDCFTVPNVCCWNLNGNYADNEAGCIALDGCNGGGNGSGGGCYKWDTSSC